MNCPKCKGEVIDIRGSYYCSKCGRRVDLNEVKEELEEEMASVKSGAIDIKDVEQSRRGNKETEPVSQEIKEAEPPSYTVPEESPAESSLREEASAHYGRQFLKDTSPPPPPPPSPLKPGVKVIPKSEPVIHLKKDTQEPAKPKTEKLTPSYHKIRILLITVVLLNILILLGIIYFFVIK